MFDLKIASQNSNRFLFGNRLFQSSCFCFKTRPDTKFFFFLNTTHQSIFKGTKQISFHIARPLQQHLFLLEAKAINVLILL